MKKTNNRREFIKKSAMATAGLSSLGALSFSAKSYGNIIGANDRLNLAICGLGRRLGAYFDPIARKESNVNLLYLCDVMKSQRENAAKQFSKHMDHNAILENSIFKVIEDPKVDAIINATPDHWHAPGTWMAVEKGKHVYVEKPCSHNPREGELLVAYQKKYQKVIQMGNQQRSSMQSIEIINDIHNGAIGKPYKATAFYSNARGRVVNPTQAPVPDGLDWDLFQGPSPRKEYMHDTWDYNWHWYGWDFGTAETGNNATHELDIARWALQVDFPEEVMVDSGKYHWVDDGWTMYDTMMATFKFKDNKTIEWDGKSRNSYNTYGGGRGTIIYGTEGSAFIDRDGYKLYNRNGKMIKKNMGSGSEGGVQLGGGGDMSTAHMVNFFQAIRGKEAQRSPIDEGAKSTLLCHYANISSRTGEVLKIDDSNGHITNSRAAQKLWSRRYEKGYEPKL
ncbi:Gfo/Idh/MocA family oxidoreductase [Echinicola jeungdonensis]|uniref:Gfo/Idh/MocA family protein n=1 Tax=Echinicola jeungdonensis TaxID=709343 RepID=A0ABV5J3W8_9BACT|nr:Gfo/Idh/MocA family oxidoreductase [Echinicola jeungdonensis]MDN3670651.1 Gfo/Idh/MocA family oxidoreductase [Echinicola jeungdonensis]